MLVSVSDTKAANDMKEYAEMKLPEALAPTGASYARILAFEEEFVNEWLQSHLASEGRRATVVSLVEYVSNHPADTSQIGIVRNIGKKIGSEFISAVLDTLQINDQPFAKGRLLNLLRDAAPKDASVIAKLLSDGRPAEELSKLATAEGSVPFRVCDVAYNVLQEVGAADKTTTKLLVRSSSIEERDELVAPIREQTPRPNATPLPPDPQPPTPATPVPTTAPAPPPPSPTVAESPAPVVERESPVWPWLVGILTLLAIVAFVLKRRA